MVHQKGITLYGWTFESAPLLQVIIEERGLHSNIYDLWIDCNGAVCNALNGCIAGCFHIGGKAVAGVISDF